MLKRASGQMVTRVLKMLNARDLTVSETADFMSSLLKKACSVYPGLADELSNRDLGTNCKCGSLYTCLAKVQQCIAPRKDDKLTRSFVSAVQDVGFRNRRAVRKHGIEISRKAWVDAKKQHGSSGKTAGRPSIRKDALSNKMVSNSV